MIYLDNAATTFPKPVNVRAAVMNSMKESANPGRSGYKLSLAASERIYTCRQKIAGFFSLEKEENCILTPSCTIALNTLIYGLLKKGDHVVISAFEHNSVVIPLKKLADKGIITYSVAEVFSHDDDRTVESFRNKIRDNTKLLICTHASNVFGIKLPASRISALCKYYGVLFCIDAAQTAGMVDIDIQDIGADFIAAPGHKGLYGPMGTGFLLINSPEFPQSLYQGGTGMSDPEFNEPFVLPEKFEAGTVNLSGFCGLSEGIDFVNSKTINKISKYEFNLIKHLYYSLRSIKSVKLYTGEPDEKYNIGLLSFNIDDVDCNAVSDILDKRYGICVRSGLHCSPLAHKFMNTIDRGTVRVSVSAFTTISEINKFINAIFLISKGKNNKIILQYQH